MVDDDESITIVATEHPVTDEQKAGWEMSYCNKHQVYWVLDEGSCPSCEREGTNMIPHDWVKVHVCDDGHVKQCALCRMLAVVHESGTTAAVDYHPAHIRDPQVCRRGDMTEERLATKEKLTTAERRVAELEQRNLALAAALDRDKTGLADALDRCRKAAASRMWVTEGRGSYEWDDDEYREEAGRALREVIEIAKAGLVASGTIANELLSGPSGRENEIQRLRDKLDTAERALDEAVRRAEAAEGERTAVVAHMTKAADWLAGKNQHVASKYMREYRDEIAAGEHLATLDPKGDP